MRSFEKKKKEKKKHDRNRDTKEEPSTLDRGTARQRVSTSKLSRGIRLKQSTDPEV